MLFSCLKQISNYAVLGKHQIQVHGNRINVEYRSGYFLNMYNSIHIVVGETYQNVNFTYLVRVQMCDANVQHSQRTS